MSKANELSLANVGGVFVVLLAGMGLACLIAVFEFIWKSRKLATEDNVRHNQFICKGFSHTSKHLFKIKKYENPNIVQFADYRAAVTTPSVVNYILELS